MTPSRHPDWAMLTQIDLRNELCYSTAHHSLIEQSVLVPCSDLCATEAACEGSPRPALQYCVHVEVHGQINASKQWHNGKNGLISDLFG